ncbi:DUF554 domain-containing protein [Desulfovibrio psychrotolerans]|uniref:Membrane protein n=1 Tax=Desulfovibrio psychrotolerans TaxID=415242 RepID=A0A7J0BRF9_9BACT|nr:DUF554 domain-containing protein [Desulfovibrio psychrotolerans]GFM36248.1 membrane protein [Desulfovibrio psychrotolerans]
MVFPLGSVFNVVCILVGGVVGLVLGGRLPDRVRAIVFTGLGLCTLIIGLQMGLKTQNPLVLVFSILLGCITGELLRLEDRLTGFGEWMKRRLRCGNERFTEGFVSSSVLFCIGSMAILGAFDEGLRGDHTILFTKSILDGFASVAFAASFGLGVLFSSVPVFVYQAGLTQFATVLQPILSEPMMTELTAAGGTLIIGISVNLMELRRIPLTNMLPALLYAPILAHFLM